MDWAATERARAQATQEAREREAYNAMRSEKTRIARLASSVKVSSVQKERSLVSEEDSRPALLSHHLELQQRPATRQGGRRRDSGSSGGEDDGGRYDYDYDNDHGSRTRTRTRTTRYRGPALAEEDAGFNADYSYDDGRDDNNNHAPHPPIQSRGRCPACNRIVLTSDRRWKSGQGEYYHEVCPAAEAALPDGWEEAETERAAAARREHYAGTRVQLTLPAHFQRISRAIPEHGSRLYESYTFPFTHTAVGADSPNDNL